MTFAGPRFAVVHMPSASRRSLYAVARIVGVDGAPCAVYVTEGAGCFHATWRSKAKAFKTARALAAATPGGQALKELYVRDFLRPAVEPIKLEIAS